MASLHAGCPVIKGIKWSATKWCAAAAESRTRRASPVGTARGGNSMGSLSFIVVSCRMHVGEFQMEQRRRKLGGCADQHEGCPIWAEGGECEKNPAYMARPLRPHTLPTIRFRSPSRRARWHRRSASARRLTVLCAARDIVSVGNCLRCPAVLSFALRVVRSVSVSVLRHCRSGLTGRLGSA